MTQTVEHQALLPDECNGQRLDQAVSQLFPDYSRSRLQQWIKSGALTVDGRPAKPRDKVIGGERIVIAAELEEETHWTAQPIELDIVHEDDDLLIVDKPAGLVVHPAAGNPDGTLVNALLHHYPPLAHLPRAGIVHRIDKETSGLLAVAKSLRGHTALSEQLQDKSAFREYEAVATGVMTGGGMVDAPLGRHPTQRLRQAVAPEGLGKPAVTHYRVIKRFRAHTHIRLQLETGRTHQIRVHMAHIRYPLVGDPLYGGRLKLPKGATEPLVEALRGFKRQALHARRLGFVHPADGEYVEWDSPLPADLQRLLTVLEQDLDAVAD